MQSLRIVLRSAHTWGCGTLEDWTGKVAFDGVQRSTRYPGGVALRFARVVRYRDDKPVSEIDTIETVRSFLA